MIDKSLPDVSNRYTSFMVWCVAYLVSRGEKPFILVHEGDADYRLAEEISYEAGGIPIVRETDPLAIKGILGSSYATIGSRFHGLVSALSQGVPSLGTGWSHKYLELFKDYGWSDGLIKVGDEDVKSKLDQLIDPQSNLRIRRTLEHHSDQLKEATELMWERVFEVIENSKKSETGR
ncbi:polysaccharide pyruvyl transferase family protein [Alkalilimnicola ehrlichii]|nr:polysaccharide pyruvyl transferase family protein [Alkalilimnicola ehrlichii]